jgi:hypothetical protein
MAVPVEPVETKGTPVVNARVNRNRSLFIWFRYFGQAAKAAKVIAPRTLSSRYYDTEARGFCVTAS